MLTHRLLSAPSSHALLTAGSEPTSSHSQQKRSRRKVVKDADAPSSLTANERLLYEKLDTSHILSSIRRVFSTRPEYAQRIIRAVQELPDETRQLHQRSRESRRRRNSSKSEDGNLSSSYGTVSRGESQARKTAGSANGVQGGPSVASTPSSTSNNRVKRKRGANHQQDDEDDEDDDKANPYKRSLPEGRRHKTWLCPYSLRFPRLTSGACRLPTTFKTLSDLK